MFVAPRWIVWLRFFMALIPMAARVPIIVEITAASSVICSVVENADIIRSL